MAKKARGKVEEAVGAQAARAAAGTIRPSRPVEYPKPVSVTVPPPAYQGGKEMPPAVTVGQLGRTIATAGAGTLITAVFITGLQGGTKFIGSLIGAGVGTIFLATSPAGTVPSDLGIGMLAGSAGWFALHITGKVK